MTSPGGAIGRPTLRTRLRLSFGDTRVEVPVEVPGEPVPPADILPAARRIVDEIVAAARRDAAKGGRAVACGPRCAACCRQAVAISDVEAWALADLVDRMAEPRRGEVRAGFDAAAARLEAAGLRGRFERAGDGGGEATGPLGREYFALRVDCPFLSDESCSIYADRPLACREYVVTSPPAHCATLDTARIAALPVMSLSVGLQTITSDPAKPRRRWIALPLALAWAAANPPPSGMRRPGPAWIEALLRPTPGAS
ncbi:MAG: YkgJ family cysteine cluster protein [Rhodospirillales bacterium]|nr:MAG: YkgJ family cysteine cluster protein [Rhodospirillales bacterium]